MASTSKYLVAVMPVLKGTKVMANQMKKLGMQAAKDFGGSFKFSVGSLMADAVKGALASAQNKVSETANAIEQTMSRDKMLEAKSQRYGVSSSKLDALGHLAKSQGIDEGALFSALDSLQRRSNKGEIKIAGKDIVDKFANAISFLQKQSGGRRDYNEEQLFGGSELENLYIGKDSKKLDAVTEQLGLLKGGKLYNKTGGLINNSANRYDKIILEKEKLQMQVQDKVRDQANKNPNTTQGTALFEMREQTAILKQNLNKQNEIIKAAKLMADAQKVSNDISNKILGWVSDLVKKITAFFDKVKKDGFYKTVFGK